MSQWWSQLSGVNQGFFIAAAFFSLVFLWQLVMTLIGFGGAEDADVDTDVDADVDADMDADADGDFAAGHDAYGDFEHDALHDAGASLASFRLISLRSIVAFCTLFSWAGALYIQDGVPLAKTLTLSILWGFGAMLAVALAYYLLRKLTESGNLQLATCVGTNGTVYLNIPGEGAGEVRVSVSGVISHVKARADGGKDIKAGTGIRVVRVLDPSTVLVEPLQEGSQSGSNQS